MVNFAWWIINKIQPISVGVWWRIAKFFQD